MAISFDIDDPFAYGSRVGVSTAVLVACDLFYFTAVRKLAGDRWWYPGLSDKRGGPAYVLTSIVFCAVLFGIVASLFICSTLAEAAAVGCLLGILVFGVFNACCLVLIDDWTMTTAAFDFFYGIVTYTGASAAIWHLL